MFIIAFIILEIVKHNVHHFPAVANVALWITGIVGGIELFVYLLLIIGTVLGIRKALK